MPAINHLTFKALENTEIQFVPTGFYQSELPELEYKILGGE